MSLDTMRDLFVGQLKDVYSAEKQLVKALPRLAKAANASTLSDAITSHLRQTEQHVKRLEKVFAIVNEPPRAKFCDGMAGLIEEGREAMDEDGDDALFDANLIAAAQRVEHYEIAAYGCLIRFAEKMGEAGAAALLRETLAEEKAADETLTAVSDSEIMANAPIGAVTRADGRTNARVTGRARRAARTVPTEAAEDPRDDAGRRAELEDIDQVGTSGTFISQ